MFRRLHIPLRSMVIIGAAGGIAAILHAPVAGAIMAVESPYRKGLAKETLVESLLAAFVSYYSYSLILDPRPLFTYPLVDYSYEAHDLYVFVILGVCAGYSSRAMLGLWNFISLKIIPKLNHDWRMKYAVGGVLLSGIAFFALHFYGSSFTMYSGLLETNHVLDNHYALYEATGLFILKTLATIVTFAFGGVGGLFVPSATIGASLGFILQTVTKTKLVGTLPYLGIASFIGASYNSFLFSLVFLIETTQNGSLFVPGLITCGIAYFISYGISNSKSQR